MDPKPLISRENILKHVDALDIFRIYLKKDFVVGSAFSSPFRQDRIPSFAIFQNKLVPITSYKHYLYKDFVLGGGDCFIFVKMLFGYSSWFETYSRIAVDFQLDDRYTVKKGMSRLRNSDEIKNFTPKIKSKIKLEVKSREKHEKDVKFWMQFGITPSILEQYRVIPIDYIFITPEGRDRMILKADEYAYAFIEHKDNEITYKIYQPYSKYKWMSSHNDSVWQGWRMLPKEDRNLIITKSLKDVMSIMATELEIPAVSLQAESVKPKDSVIEELKSRFDKIYVLYDNDFDKKENWGQKFANDICHKYGFKNLCLPEKEGAKDISDLIKTKGMNHAKQVLSDLLYRDIIKEQYKDIPFL